MLEYINYLLKKILILFITGSLILFQQEWHDYRILILVIINKIMRPKFISYAIDYENFYRIFFNNSSQCLIKLIQNNKLMKDSIIQNVLVKSTAGQLIYECMGEFQKRRLLLSQDVKIILIGIFGLVRETYNQKQIILKKFYNINQKQQTSVEYIVFFFGVYDGLILIKFQTQIFICNNLENHRKYLLIYI
ncbi:unnamed protein product [Paramecium primaurelia]|uniref:Uncharacterized protein n=1 Tax=Paramecium primaurelia TaxID=5886 RepID=A0A8S1JNG2_PARPR|nr:unnamed protein product [Paramecium primaurelia]